MPIVDDEAIQNLLADGKITALTMDTNIFDQKQQLGSKTLQSLVSLKQKHIAFVLAQTVVKEVHGHLVLAGENKLRAAKKAIGEALYTFETTSPTRDNLLAEITGNRSPEAAATERLDQYIALTDCEVLDDTALVDIATVYNDYFKGNPPFGKGKKKDEFPDALALNALEQTARDKKTSILVVSGDSDWVAFCSQSQRLFLVPAIEKALAIVANAPVGLRDSITKWLLKAGARTELMGFITGEIERMDIDADANPTSGEVEAIAWDPKLSAIHWPDDDEIDIIDVSNEGGGAWRVTVSLPMLIDLRIPVELNFTMWDSIDRESVGMGGRDIEVPHQLDTRATFALLVKDQGTATESIEAEEGEIDERAISLYLGEVDVFEHDGYDN